MQGPSVKRRIITIFRIANTGLHNLFRNAWLTTAAIAVMTVTLTIVVSATVANFSLQEAIEVASRDLTVSIFLKDDAPEDIQDQLRDRIAANEYVDEVYYKSKAEALTDFQERNKDNQQLIAGISLSEGNPLPASFEVFMTDINEFDSVLAIAKDEQYVDVVRETNDNQSSRDAFNGFITAQDKINSASIILGLIFGSISILVIFNTIRMAIFTRSNEIEIMKLIGATPNYIRGPYLFESAMYGVIAGVISISVVYALTVPFARNFLEGEVGGQGVVKFDTIFPDGVITYFTEQWYMVFLLTIGAGVLVGLVSSSVAMAKYLRLKKW
jgi:cell division transport system permease protein